MFFYAKDNKIESLFNHLYCCNVPYYKCMERKPFGTFDCDELSRKNTYIWRIAVTWTLQRKTFLFAFYQHTEKQIFSFYQELPLASFSASLGFLVTESEIPIVKEIGKRTFFHGNYTWAALEAEANRLIMIDGTSYSQYLVRNRFTNRLVLIMRPYFKRYL